MMKMMMRISTIVPMPMYIPGLLPVGRPSYPVPADGNAGLAGGRPLQRSGGTVRQPGSIRW